MVEGAAHWSMGAAKKEAAATNDHDLLLNDEDKQKEAALTEEETQRGGAWCPARVKENCTMIKVAGERNIQLLIPSSNQPPI